MQLHEIKPIHKLKKSRRIGRGGKKGTYSGRGIKGQKSRAGRRFKPVIRELLKKYPKLRGYRQKLKPKNVKSRVVVVNLETLEKRFTPEQKVSPETLLEKKLIRKIRGEVPKVKILGKGKLTKPLNIEGCLVSKKAKEIIAKAHGMVK
jgi:large subunit ribosomal protein L15